MGSTPTCCCEALNYHASYLAPSTSTLPVPLLVCRRRWRPPLLEYTSTKVLHISNTPVSTLDATRVLLLPRKHSKVLLVGAEGTGKTSLLLMSCLLYTSDAADE